MVLENLSKKLVTIRPSIISASLNNIGYINDYLYHLANLTLSLQNSSFSLINRIQILQQENHALKAENLSLKAQLNRDELTGLYNRRYLIDALVKRCQTLSCDEPYSLVFIDLDDFKLINDQYGHAFGDHALQSFSNALSNSLPQGAVAARIGGEEFAVLMPTTDQDKANDWYQSLFRATQASPLPTDNTAPLIVKFSAGICTVNLPLQQKSSSTPKQFALDILHQADLAMYKAKTHKSGCRMVFYR